MQDFSCPALLRCRFVAPQVVGYGPFTLCGGVFQHLLLTFLADFIAVLLPRTPRRHGCGLGSCAYARHYLRNHCCFLFLRVLRCFSSPGSPHRFAMIHDSSSCGLPHSDIRGSMDICSSPRLFAACHVLRRLREPRHPSYALLSFPFSFGKSPFIFSFAFS